MKRSIVYLNRKKSKKIVSMIDFLAAIGRVAKYKNETYFVVSCEISSRGKIQLQGYINSYGYKYGNTVDEVIEQFTVVNEPKTVIKDIVITD